MEKLYYTESYLKEADARVLSVEKTDKNTLVTLDRPLFYPEGGGQSGDRGSINNLKVLDTKKSDDGNSILYLSRDDFKNIKEKQSVHQKLDWKFRYTQMKVHTAQHLLSGLLFTAFNIGTEAVHLGDGYLTIETSVQSIKRETIDELVSLANQRIWEARPVTYKEMSHAEAEALGLRRSIKVEGDVRIVEIEGTDRIACGGVHVSKTSEIGIITAGGQEQIRGHARLLFRCGENALETAVLSQKEVEKICGILSCKTEETSGKTASLLTELTRTKAALAVSELKAAAAEVRENIKDGTAVFETELPTARFQGQGDRYEDLALCVIKTEEDRCTWTVVVKGKFAVDMKELSRVTGAKGGGRAPLFQGIVSREKKEEFKKSFLNLLTNA